MLTPAMAAGTVKDAARARRSRRIQERGEVTQRKLLDATVACLVEYGYANMSTTKVSEYAGISRGAQQHHFPLKSELVAEAVAYLADQRSQQLVRKAKRLPRDRSRVEGAVDLLWSGFSGRLFEASLELWIASRTDDELRRALVDLERHVADATNEVCRELFGPQVAADPHFDDKIQLAINTMRGVALLQVLQRDSGAHRRQWSFARESLIGLFSST